jgi:hypothetical protein
MLPANMQSNPITEGDIMALDALFKRIAERGRKIRTQNRTASSDNLGRENQSAEQDPKPLSEESYHSS